MRDRGYNDLGDAVRALPSNFGGGQNPTVAQGSGGRNNNNINGSSSLNLRGLGADATLTLINGHRLSYDGVYQGVDISAIPLAAVDRLEIVPDGASALYGSDAVGGVANVILKRDFSGLNTSARVGGSTDGGNLQQEYGAVTGDRWSSGGFILAGDYGHATAVTAGQRSYTNVMNPSATLIPYLRHFSVLLSGHEDLDSTISLGADAFFNVRHSGTSYAYLVDQPATYYGLTSADREQTFSVAPHLDFHLGPQWTASLSGTYSFDNTRIDSLAANQGPQTPTRIDDNNQLRSIEGSAEGPIFSLPGGSARLAIGAGYHVTSLHQRTTQAQILTLDTHASRENEYGYGEIFLPFLGPAQQVPGIRRLSLDFALRYESYPSLSSLARPKAGIIYEPIDGVVLKGSWGKSFKAPTLLEQFSTTKIQLVNASELGSNSFPTGATTLYLYGANPNLKPETATTWTATLEVKPAIAPGLKVSVDYFHIHYGNRVVAPVTSVSGIYTNGLYSNYLSLNPTQAQVAAALAAANQPLQNLSGAAFDASNVAAIINDINVNATTQSLYGADAALRYDHRLGDSDSQIHVSADATYLHSRQQVTSQEAFTALAGTIYNPPHWRANGTLGWSDKRASVTASVNYVGSVVDNLSTPQVTIRAMTTFDLVTSLTLDPRQRLLRDVTIRLSALNLFNRKPEVVRQSAIYVTPFDSTNYSSIGRYLGVSVDKSW